MIPKTIHYCWFGGAPLPKLAKRCIRSWKLYCPDYQIIRWDETNTDLTENDYIREAYDNRKWAFVTDYVRLAVLYRFGGIYMDTDVELVKPLDPFLSENAFSGFEDEAHIPTGIIASEKAHSFIGKLLEYYDGRHFVKPDKTLDETTNVETITGIASNLGFIPNGKKQSICGMTIYPQDYFCPKDYHTGMVSITDHTFCIHHFNGSWLNKDDRQAHHFIVVRHQLRRKYGVMGEPLYYIYRYLLHPKQLYLKLTNQI